MSRAGACLGRHAFGREKRSACEISGSLSPMSCVLCAVSGVVARGGSWAGGSWCMVLGGRGADPTPRKGKRLPHVSRCRLAHPPTTRLQSTWQNDHKSQHGTAPYSPPVPRYCPAVALSLSCSHGHGHVLALVLTLLLVLCAHHDAREARTACARYGGVANERPATPFAAGRLERDAEHRRDQ